MDIEDILQNPVFKDLTGNKEKLTYFTYLKLHKLLVDNSLNVQVYLPKLVKIIDPQAQIPTKVSNLSRKVFKLARKCTDKNQDILYQTISGIHKKPELSPDFLAAGLSVTNLVKLDFDLNLPMNLKIKHIVELKAVLTKNKLSWKFAVEWLKLLQKLDVEISPESVALQWKRICKKKIELVRAKRM